MNKLKINLKVFVIRLFALVILLLVALSANAQEIKDEQNLVPGEDVILQWNRVLLQTTAIPGQQNRNHFDPRFCLSP